MPISGRTGPGTAQAAARTGWPTTLSGTCQVKTIFLVRVRSYLLPSLADVHTDGAKARVCDPLSPEQARHLLD